MTAVEVLMAVPNSCRKWRTPNSKILFCIMIRIANLTASIEKSLGSSGASSLSHQLMTLMAGLVLMLLYIKLASAVNTLHGVGSEEASVRPVVADCCVGRNRRRA